MSSTTQSTRSRSSRGSIDSIALEMGRRSLSTYPSVSSSTNSAILPLLDGDDEESRPGFNDGEKKYTQELHIVSENMFIVVSGRKTSKSGLALYALFCTFTLGLGYLALRYLPQWRSYLTQSASPLHQCDSVLIENQWGEAELQKIAKISCDKWSSLYSGFIFNDEDYKYLENRESDLRFFEYRYVRLIYHPAVDRFVFASQWTDPRWNDLDDVRNGLSSEDVSIRQAVFGKNLIDIEEKSTGYILLDEILHPFYIFQIGSLVLWALDDYLYYAACIFLISGMSILAALFETKATVRHLREISVFECKIRVIRNGFWRFMDSSSLVPGDVYEVTDPDLSQVPCDSILLSGDCILNESMLTGESVPVSKSPATHDVVDHILETNTGSNSVAAKHILFGGTHIVRARRPQDSEGSEAVSLALVVRGGFNTTKGNLVRSMLFPKPTGFKFYSDSFRYIRVMAMVAMFGVVMSFFKLKRFELSWKTITIRALDLITIIVPPALPATLTIGSSFAVRRLKKNNIFCISPQRVNIGGKVNAVCFDKTGTLTEDDLNVYGLLGFQSQSKSFDNLITNISSLVAQHTTSPTEELRKLSNIKTLFYTMAACHSLRHVKGSIIGDPLDIKMFTYTGWTFEESDSPSGYHDEEEQINLSPRIAQGSFYVPLSSENQHSPLKQVHVELGIFRVFDYFPQTRRASVVARQYDSQEFYVYAKGAPESIHDICRPDSLPADYEDVLMSYTQRGFRVIACAAKKLPKFNWLKAQKISRLEAESRLEFVGLVIFENRMKPATRDVIGELNHANIRNIMCTGDNLYTAISVAKDCDIVDRRTHCFVPQLKNVDNAENPRLQWQSMSDSSVVLDGKTLKPVSWASERDARSFDRLPDLYNCSFALTGEVFRWVIDHTSNSTLNMILRYGQVFARMSPDDKHELVERLQSIDYCCAFCGDGANDCGALQAADVGISLSEAEASVAAPFTSRTYDITCVPNIIREGRAALVTSFSCFKYMSLYSAIQFISVSFLYNIASNFGDFQFLYIDLLVTLPLAIFMAWSEPHPILVSKRPTASLMSYKVLTSLLGHIAIILMMQSVAYYSVQEQSWFIPPVHHKDKVNILNSQNTVLFLISCYQYLYYSVILNPGPPFRRPPIYSVPFPITFLVILLFTSLLLFKSPSWLKSLMQLTEMSISFKFLVFFLGLGGYVLGTYGELHVFSKIAQKLKELRNANSSIKARSRKRYKSIPGLQ